LISTLSILTFSQVYNGSKTIKSSEEKLNDQYCSALFRNYDGTIFDLVNDNQSVHSYLNILDWLEGRVAGLQVFVSRTGARIPYIRGTYAGIFVDEIPIDPGYLNLLPVSDIAMIKIIKDPFIGNFGCESTIAIYTIKGDDEEEEQE